jgi:hypothetical protein
MESDTLVLTNDANDHASIFDQSDGIHAVSLMFVVPFLFTLRMVLPA